MQHRCRLRDLGVIIFFVSKFFREVIFTRLWHWQLIPGLPRQQLLGQWRECCLIAKNMAENGTPNHILVDPIVDYPIDHFISYSKYVFDEMSDRGYHVNRQSFMQYIGRSTFYRSINSDQLFPDWHTDEYLRQCYYNLEEKHDRGGITDEEWKNVQDCIKGEYRTK